MLPNPLMHIFNAMMSSGDQARACKIADQALLAIGSIADAEAKVLRETVPILPYLPDTAIRLKMLCQILFAARLEGRGGMFKTLAAVAPVLASLDTGKTLLHVYNSIMDTESLSESARLAKPSIREGGSGALSIPSA